MFIVEWSRTRVVFGAGTIERLGTELDALGLARCLLVTTPRRDATIASVLAELGDRLAGVCDIAAMHVPSDRVQRALAEIDRIRPDVLVAVGGGSAVGLAKAIARERSLPIVAVPTTYAGSEMTSIWGITAGDTKTTGRDPAVAPRLVIYDPVLTLWLPPHTSAASGMNAMAHAVEAMYAPDASPMAAAVAEDAIRTLARALPSVLATPRDLDARTLALRGAHAAAMALELAPMGLHHKLCHVLGGRFNLVHADAHSVILPHAIAFNAPALPDDMARLAAALGSPGGDPAGALWDLAIASNVPTRLADLKGQDGLLQRDDLAGAAHAAAEEITVNPRPVTEADLLGILERAYEGERP